MAVPELSASFNYGYKYVPKLSALFHYDCRFVPELGKWPVYWCDKHISVKELFPIVLALKIWPSHLRDMQGLL